MFPLPHPTPPHPRKADEGLASLSEDGRSPISIRQMAYGEPRERDWRRGLDTPLSQGSQNMHMFQGAAFFPFIPDFQGEVVWRESRCGGIVTGNGARSLVIRLQRSLTLMRPSFPPVSGLSFGIISGVFSVINILADALGPGVVGIHGDSPYYFLTSGKICFLPCLHAPSIPGPDLIYWSSLGDFFGSTSQEAGSR